MNSTTAFRLSAILGLLAVALGASGAHGHVHDLLAKNQTLEIWEKAVFYHLVHAVVLLFVASRNPFPTAVWFLFFFGVLFFSGSLYGLALTGARWLGPVTPLGGVSLLGGWLMLAWRGSA